MQTLSSLIHGLILAGFIALKISGYTWSWWWLLFPEVPVIAKIFGI